MYIKRSGPNLLKYSRYDCEWKNKAFFLQPACLTFFQIIRVNNCLLPQHDPNQQRRNEGIHLEKEKYYFSTRVADAIPIMVCLFLLLSLSLSLFLSFCFDCFLFNGKIYTAKYYYHISIYLKDWLNKKPDWMPTLHPQSISVRSYTVSNPAKRKIINK